jgi:hypothetical protein
VVALSAVIFAVRILVVGGDTGVILTGVAAAIALAAAVRSVGLAVRDAPVCQRLLWARPERRRPGRGDGLVGPVPTGDHGRQAPRSRHGRA